MGLILEGDAREIDFDGLRELETPAPTRTHHPVPHARVVEMLRYSLGFYGHEITTEQLGVTEDNMRFFGVLSLRSRYGGWEDTMIVRNSHDRSFSLAFGLGSRVMCCSNLAFFAETIIRRKHTKGITRELPGIIAELVEPLAEQRKAQAKTLKRYKATQLTPALADHAIMEAYRSKVINVTRIAEVAREWETPSHDEWQQGSAYHLFNAVTFSLGASRVIENGATTKRLHDIITGVCILANAETRAAA